MATQVPPQPAVTEFASDLCDYINANILDEQDLDVMGFLDALASCGLTLTNDPNGEASNAYFQILAEWD